MGCIEEGKKASPDNDKNDDIYLNMDTLKGS
jgi:hypothetical protein